jgi:uncharacterized membrane protein
MKLKFVFDLEDWMEFNKYHLQMGKKRKILFMVMFILFVFWAISFGVSYFSNDKYIFSLTDFLFPFLFILYILLYFYIPWNIKHQIGKKENASALGEVEYDLTEEFLFVKKSSGLESKIPWTNFCFLKENKQYLFLYQNTFSAYVFPKFKLGEQELKDLTVLLEKKREQFFSENPQK